jgi:hypothetical protein
MVGHDDESTHRIGHTDTTKHALSFCSSCSHLSTLSSSFPALLPPSPPYVDVLWVQISRSFYPTLQLAEARLALRTSPGLTHATAVLYCGWCMCCAAR